jgi:hypothetical protein
LRMMAENPQRRQQVTLPHGKKGFLIRLQSTASCSIGTAQSGRRFLVFQGVGSNAPSNNSHCREGKIATRAWIISFARNRDFETPSDALTSRLELINDVTSVPASERRK